MTQAINISVQDVVRNKIALLREDKVMVAKIRNAVHKKYGEVRDVHSFMVKDTPSEWNSDSGKPSKEQLAIHAALTLYAWHSMGWNADNSTTSFGEAVGYLIRKKPNMQNVIRVRFNAAAQASDVVRFVRNAHGLIKHLSSANIGFDYPQFAGDLLNLQMRGSRDSVTYQWASDMYR